MIPETLDFKTTFSGVFQFVADNCYSGLNNRIYADLEEYKADLANAVSETLAAMGVDEPDEMGDWYEPIQDVLDALGFTPEQDDDR